MTNFINAVPVENIDEYKNVFVFLENRAGKIQRSSLEMIGIGKELANKVNEKLTCILIGHSIEGMAKEAESYGCDKILGADAPELEQFRTMPYASIIVDFIKEEKPNIFLLAATHNGRDLASRIAVKSQTGVTADCTVIDVEPDTRILLANRPTYGESSLAEILCKKHRPQMATARPGIFKFPDKVPGNKSEMDIRKIKVKKDLIKKEIVEFKPKEEFDITAAKVVVAGGLGLGGKKGFDMLQELADEINGEVGASRPAVDMGWITRDHQVGQTGKTVRPRLYIAAGISGKAQHIAGMKLSDTIIAINNDPEAEIIKYSDYVIQEDANQVIPKLIEEIRNYKKHGPKKKVEEKKSS